MTAAQTVPPAPPLRTWQRRALSAYLLRRPADFLAVATPGAGKTTFALRAAELLADRTAAAVTVVTPTEHLKTQWAAAAAALGIPLDPTFRNADGATARDFRGAVVTYAQVAAAPALHRARTAARRTLVVLDEVHHAGDALSWGDAVRESFAPAARRLALTQGDYEQARAHYDAALALFQQLEDQRGVATALNGLAGLEGRLGNYAQSQAHFDAALERFQQPYLFLTKQALWAVVLLLGTVIAMPVYWYLYVWREAARTNSLPPRPPSASAV